jgi:signal transduction histidine kinase
MSSSPGAATDAPPFAASDFDQILLRRGRSRWIGWRLRLLVGLALSGCLLLFVVVRSLVAAPAVPAQWQPDALGRAVLQSSDEPSLRDFAGRPLERVSAAGRSVAADAALVFGTPRWTVDDGARQSLLARRAELSQMLASGSITLQFGDMPPVTVAASSRGVAGLGVSFWLLMAPALLLYLVGATVMLAHPSARSALYALMAWCQAISLLWIGMDGSRGLSVIAGPLIDDMPWRLGLDLATAAAAVHVFALHPVRLPAHRTVATLAWGSAAAGIVLAARAEPPVRWWWGQALLLALGAAAIGVLARAYRIEPHPFAAVMRRFGFVVLGTLAVVDAAVAAAKWQPAMAFDVATSAVLVWTLFFASVLVWVPFLSRSRHLMREFAMLAGLSTVATSLDLLFVSLFSLEPFASLTLAVFIALGMYAAARRWMFNQMTGSALLTTERTFEQLYRVARELQEHPERHLALVGQLLRELFEPLDLLRVPHGGQHSRVLADGSALLVPVAPPPDTDGETVSLVLRFAHRGRRMFTRDDAKLTERVVDQLRQAVAYDRAVERGRTEERLRIAQDLHDDIGARLLTLMYKAQDPEMEDYLRHTLKDLKTLTRGLAASEHRLSHAAAEWKADVQQRLTAAQIDLSWSFSFDDDLRLTVVQWSALTRVLRELVSNTIYHARATSVEIDAILDSDVLALRVSDDGDGRDPSSWAHGLGLGGVRKRVKLLGGEVQWEENAPQGIVCRVRVPGLAQRD